MQHTTERFFFFSSFLPYWWRLKYGGLLRYFVCFFFSYFFAFVPGATAKFFLFDQIKRLLADNFFLSELAPNVDEWCDFVLQKRMNKDNILQKLKNDMRCTQQTKINLSSTGNILICRFACRNMRVGRWWMSFWIPIRFTVYCAPTQQSEYTVMWLCCWNVKGVSECEWIVWAEPVYCMRAGRICMHALVGIVCGAAVMLCTEIDFPRAKRELFLGRACDFAVIPLKILYYLSATYLYIYGYAHMDV